MVRKSESPTRRVASGELIHLRDGLFSCMSILGDKVGGLAGNNLIELVDSLPLGCFCHLDCETIEFFSTKMKKINKHFRLGTLLFSVLKSYVNQKLRSHFQF